MVVFSRLARMQGSAFEGCLKAFAVASFRGVEPERPVSIYVGQRTRVVYPEVLEEIWAVALKVKKALEKRGFTIRFAQSTYKRTKPKSSFSVDLTVVHKSGCDYWLEAKFAADGDVLATLTAAVNDLKKYKTAAEEPNKWTLDDNLSGKPMVPPVGFGKLVCSKEEFLLFVDGFDNVRAKWSKVLPPPRKRNRDERVATKKASRKRLLKKRGRQFRHTQVKRAKAPLLKHPQRNSRCVVLLCSWDLIRMYGITGSRADCFRMFM